MRVFAPPRNLLRPLRGWREGTDDISDYDLALFPKNTSKEFIIVFQNEPDENKRLQWNLDLTKGQGTKKISKPTNDGFLLNSLKTLFNGVPRVLFDPRNAFKAACKICSCSVILGKLALSIFEITRASVLFSQKF